MGRILALLVFVFTLLAAPASAQAHGRDTSHSRWRSHADGVDVAVRLSARDHARLGGSRATVEAFTLGSEHAHEDTAACVADLDTLEQRDAPSGEVVLRWRFDCTDVPSPRTIDVALFDPLGPAHVHILARDGSERAQVLTTSARTIALEPEAPPAFTCFAFVRLGLVHMLGGWDHLAFVLALVVAAASWGRLALLLTGFTLGHSLTLALAALGVLRPHAAAVELLIAASIVIVAAAELELDGQRPAKRVAGMLALAAVLATVRQQASALAAWGAAVFAWGYLSGDHSRQRAWLVAAFGLIHGVGFATILQDTGLPTDARVGSLLAFNVGVEIGGLVVIAVAWPLTLRLRAAGHDPRRGVALLLACLGTMWVVQRAL